MSRYISVPDGGDHENKPQNKRGVILKSFCGMESGKRKKSPSKTTTGARKTGDYYHGADLMEHYMKNTQNK